MSGAISWVSDRLADAGEAVSDIIHDVGTAVMESKLAQTAIMLVATTNGVPPQLTAALLSANNGNDPATILTNTATAWAAGQVGGEVAGALKDSGASAAVQQIASTGASAATKAGLTGQDLGTALRNSVVGGVQNQVFGAAADVLRPESAIETASRDFEPFGNNDAGGESADGGGGMGDEYTLPDGMTRWDDDLFETDVTPSDDVGGYDEVDGPAVVDDGETPAYDYIDDSTKLDPAEVKDILSETSFGKFMKEMVGGIGKAAGSIGKFMKDNKELSASLMSGFAAATQAEALKEIQRMKNANDMAILDKKQAQKLEDQARYSASITGMAKPKGLISGVTQQPLTRVDGSKVFGSTGIINKAIAP